MFRGVGNVSAGSYVNTSNTVFMSFNTVPFKQGKDKNGDYVKTCGVEIRSCKVTKGGEVVAVFDGIPNISYDCVLDGEGKKVYDLKKGCLLDEKYKP